MKNYRESIKEIYNLSVILRDFCKNHDEIAEISQISTIAEYIEKNAEVLYAKILEEK